MQKVLRVLQQLHEALQPKRASNSWRALLKPYSDQLPPQQPHVPDQLQPQTQLLRSSLSSVQEGREALADPASVAARGAEDTAP